MLNQKRFNTFPCAVILLNTSVSVCVISCHDAVTHSVETFEGHCSRETRLLWYTLREVRRPSILFSCKADGRMTVRPLHRSRWLLFNLPFKSEDHLQRQETTARAGFAAIHLDSFRDWLKRFISFVCSGECRLIPLVQCFISFLHSRGFWNHIKKFPHTHTHTASFFF